MDGGVAAGERLGVPHKDRDKQLAYQREWYKKNAQRVKAKVMRRRRTEYAGKCRVCGDPTVGLSKNSVPEYCGKPACKSAQHKANAEVFSQAGKKGRAIQLGRVRKGVLWNPKTERFEDAFHDIDN